MTAALQLARAIAIGLGATLFIDAWNFLLDRVFGIKSLSYCLLGRWVLHMPSGVFRHKAIASAESKPFECALGLMTHYAIGIALTLGFFAVVPERWSAMPTLGPALLYGVATIVMPFFVMQPALGLGVASSLSRRPGPARLKSLATHVAYGFGLYVCTYIGVLLSAR